MFTCLGTESGIASRSLWKCTGRFEAAIFCLLKEFDQELHWYTLKQRNSSKFMLVPMIL